MSDVTTFMYSRWHPQNVKRILATGSSAFVGEIDDHTVLKYPHAQVHEERALERQSRIEMEARLDIESKILDVVCPHPRIIQKLGYSPGELYLQRGVNGTVADYLLESGKPPPSVQQRLSWCREAAEAVSHIHSRRVLHCDIQPTNLLLDEDLHIKLTDFQGKLLNADGTVDLFGGSGEPTRFCAPRDDPFDADIKTELFALGCTIYFIILGHAVYPDIIDGSAGWHEKVEERFAKQEFPQDSHACSKVTAKCWLQQYNSAEEVVQEIAAIERLHASGSC
ncbi:serine/threonine protein kinase [Venturia nashicola]|uniref:Serine/threonine protein kinase n=1 Tax=Venturia nashicola TaxID=86259 RepID=A0A4Z1NSU8_9PEZI|nr:serine/threonine protein kinase [Venturia nashicola]TID17518.1 serine/threonine protein kinase [Venturia nashicola]